MHCFSLTKIAPHSLVLAAAIYSVSIKPEDPRVYTQTYCKESALFFLSVTLSWPIAVLCHTPPVCTYSCGSTVEYCEHAIVARIYSRRPHTFHKNQIGVNNGRATERSNSSLKGWSFQTTRIISTRNALATATLVNVVTQQQVFSTLYPQIVTTKEQ